MSNKKGKKSKGVTMSLHEFTSKVDEGAGAPAPGAGQNIVYADKTKKMPTMSSWADEVEEDGTFMEKERIFLPSAPRASRGLPYEDHEIPKHPPFTAHLGNLPYDLEEEDIYKFFRGLNITELKLPRDQQANKLRGFGYVDFDSRETLIEALHMNEQKMRNRPVRITLGTGQQDRRGGDMDRSGMRGGDGERRGRGRPPAEDDDVDDWRSVMKPQGFEGGSGESDFRRGPSGPGDYNSMPRGGGGFRDRDRGFGGGPPRERRDRGPPPQDDDIEFSRSQMVQGPPPPQHYNTYGGRSGGARGGGYNRDRGDRDFYDRGDRYGGGGNDYYSRGGPPSHQQQHQGHYPPSQHSRHHSESSDHGGPSREESTWRRREHTNSQSSQQSSSHNYPTYPNAPPAPRSERSERSESPPLRQNLHPRDRTMSPSDRDRNRERDRDEYSGRRDNRGGSGGGRDDDDDDDVPPPQSQAPKERPRLVLKPRTVDAPVGEAEAGSSSIFGGAKPVDTQKREREIEEKLEKLKVEDEPSGDNAEGTKLEETESTTEGGVSGEQGPVSSGGPPRGERRERGDGPQRRGGDRDANRPQQYRANSGSGSKEAYIELSSPIASSLGGGGGGGGGGASVSASSSAASRSRMGGPMRAPPPLPITPSQTQQQAYTNQRFNLLRSDDKDRGPYRGRGGGPRRDGDINRGGPSGRGGDFNRRGPRDHDGPSMRGGGGRSFDRDYHGGSRGGRGGGYSRDDGYGGGGDRRDDYRRGPHSHGGNSHNNNQNSSIGSHSEERDRDSHSEPEDDRDMIRGGGHSDKQRGGQGGNFSDEDAEFTTVEHRRGRKSYNNRMNNNQIPPGPPPIRRGGGGAPSNDRW